MNNNKRQAAASQRLMPRGPLLLTLGGLLLVAIAAVAVWRNAAAPAFTPEITGAAKIKTDRDTVDLGNVPLGQTVQVKFEVSNVGDRQLRFTDVPYIEVVAGC
ncbi:MAG: hypothetical protein HY872_00825 [Chloroflexi bacterium]|nr:hypothetical protein [Chloroflexota bacterium]